MAREFLPCDPDQQFLLPPSMRDWLPEGHLAWFVSDLVDSLDLSGILSAYEKDEARGRRGYDPAMMTKLLVYAYSTGKLSSRAIERACFEEVPFRVLSAGNQPDHTSVASFRKRHLKDLAALFSQVLLLCRKAGMVKLGHVALDGTKVKADASKHKAMSYGRMVKAEAELEAEVRRLLDQAEKTDAKEDGRYGEARGDELPAELARRESRLAKIREAKAALEEEAKEKAREKAEETEARLREREEEERKRGRRYGGRPPHAPDPDKALPRDKDQRNFTDPDSRIMVDGATKAFTQAYNAHAAVDGESQVIVAASVTRQANDLHALLPLAELTLSGAGAMPKTLTADAGFFNEKALADPRLQGVECYVPPERRIRTQAAEAMRTKLSGEAGKEIYRRRKAIVEPVFGQIKGARGFRSFSFRGLAAVSHEWQLVCMAHNLLKLHRAGVRPALA
ncbi:MAG: IS1182 family transposase [Coriobacteriia bacterium]